MKRRLRTIAAIAMVSALAGCIHDQDTADAPVAAVAVASYNVGGSVTGLTATGLSLADGSNIAAVAAGATTFQLPNKIAAGASVSVTVQTQPQGQSCRVNNGNATLGSADITNIQVICSINDYSVGGLITGLSAGGLSLANGTDTLTPTLGTSAFVMPTHVSAGGTYALSIQTQPTGLTCQMINGSGSIVAAAVTNVIVACGQWTWQGGSSREGASGSFGSQGSVSSSNVPPARSGAAAWIDTGGNLWLFGGAAGNAQLNDLWRFSAGQWAWMGGSQSSNAAGNYGSLGTAAAGNVPGARAQASSATDAAGNLWLFGGTGHDSAGTSGSLNDLWKYSPTQNQWTWMAGANTAWAASDTPPSSMPGGRAGAVAWADSSGHLWLFGGNSAQGPTNDLWQLTLSGLGWTLVSGTQTVNQNGVYGSAGMAASTNVPGSRAQAVGTLDSAGNLWLFGGSGFGMTGGAGLLNDLWKFSPSTDQWTWVSGFVTVNAAGNYGTRSLTAVKSPGARAGASAIADAGGNLWLLGGSGYDVNGKQGMLNDLWKYDATSSQWIWMSGSQTNAAPGVYNMLATATAGSTPGARGGATLWTDASGNVWLFGGQGLDSVKASGALNDLWQFAP